jgi:hypothetical protein
MPPRKTDFAIGLETILNNPQTSFLKNPKTFGEIHSQSKMPLASMIKTIGKGAKDNKGKPKEPTDEEKSEARLKMLDAKQKS